MKIIRVLLLFVAFYANLFAVDATLDIVKTMQTPNIEVAYLDSKNSEMAKKIYKILINDLKVSGHFEVFDSDKYSGNSVNFVAYKTKKLIF